MLVKSTIVIHSSFVNRNDELGYLNSVISRKEFQLVIVYGRRRVGKTRLLLELIDNQEAIYFLCTEQDEGINLLKFRNDIKEQLGDDEIDHIRDDWESIFRFLAEKNLIIIIDEFPYLLSQNPSIKSLFQRIIDKYMTETQMKLFLTGSSLSMMKSEVLGIKSPLYGRRTGQIKINQLGFQNLHSFFPNYSFEDLVYTYGALGGMPYYLLQFDPDTSFWDNIETKILSQFEVLYEEAEFLLRQEFTAASTYMSILLQIAAGRTTANEIKQHISVSGDISAYLKNLRELELITRQVPLGQDEIKSRMGRYFLNDNYLRFWFRFVNQNRSKIQRGQVQSVRDEIEKEYHSFIGFIFEDIVQQWLQWENTRDTNVIDHQVNQIGRWWYKDTEIDLIAYSDRIQTYIEIKWSTLSQIDAERILASLIRKSLNTGFTGEARYMLVCREYQNDKEALHQLKIFDREDMLQRWIE